MRRLVQIWHGWGQEINTLAAKWALKYTGSSILIIIKSEQRGCHHLSFPPKWHVVATRSYCLLLCLNIRKLEEPHYQCQLYMSFSLFIREDSLRAMFALGQLSIMNEWGAVAALSVFPTLIYPAGPGIEPASSGHKPTSLNAAGRRCTESRLA